jgi:hypothetical protein
MASVWLHSALWLGLALLASLISIRVAISVALIEIVVGVVAANRSLERAAVGSRPNVTT